MRIHFWGHTITYIKFFAVFWVCFVIIEEHIAFTIRYKYLKKNKGKEHQHHLLRGCNSILVARKHEANLLTSSQTNLDKSSLAVQSKTVILKLGGARNF